jgi:hypothetical protein
MMLYSITWPFSALIVWLLGELENKAKEREDEMYKRQWEQKVLDKARER